MKTKRVIETLSGEQLQGVVGGVPTHHPHFSNGSESLSTPAVSHKYPFLFPSTHLRPHQ
jgi:hypothetical protein